MIAMQVTDEDMIDLLLAELVFPKLVLAPLTAIDQKLVVMNGQVLRGGKSPVRRQRAAGTENSKPEVRQGSPLEC